MLRLCWIDVYLKSLDYILHDAEKNFVSKKFRQLATFMTIIIKSVSVEVHWSIEVVERYHFVLRRAYRAITDDLKTSISKEIALQMTIETINDIAESNELVSILLVFEIYLQMHSMNSPSSFIIQRTIAIQKAMNEIRKCRTEQQMTDVFNTRNELMIISLHDLVLNFDVLVWRKDNAE